MPLHVSDRQTRWALLGATSVLPKVLRVPLRRTSLARMELARAQRAQLLVIGHPKSGNTWLRTMLSRLYQQRFGMPSDFTVKTDELHRRDSRAPRLLSSNGHYSYEGVLGEALAEGAQPNPLRNKPVMLLARHPGDVAVSWFHQFTKRQSGYKNELVNASLEYSIDRHTIGMWEFVRTSPMGVPFLIDYLNTWERRVDALPRAIVVRYEDLRARQRSELARIFEFIGESVSEEELQDVVEWTSFDNLSRLELAGHFRSGGIQKRVRDPDSRKVRRGTVGGFRSDFSPAQVAEIDELVQTRLSPRFGYASLDQ